MRFEFGNTVEQALGHFFQILQHAFDPFPVPVSVPELPIKNTVIIISLSEVCEGLEVLYVEL